MRYFAIVENIKLNICVPFMIYLKKSCLPTNKVDIVVIYELKKVIYINPSIFNLLILRVFNNLFVLFPMYYRFQALIV